MMGAVLQTVNVRLPQPQIAYTLQHANAEILLVHRDFFPIVDALLPSLPAIKAVIAIMDGARGPIPDWDQGEYETISARASANDPFPDFDENAVANDFYTPGTTGTPNGSTFTYSQLVRFTRAGAGPFGSSPFPHSSVVAEV